MQVRKIKAIRPDFSGSCGPSETVDLGIEIDGHAFMFGTFYFGPYESTEHVALYKIAEAFLDACVNHWPGQP